MGWTIAAVGGAVVFGWAVDSTFLKSIDSSFASMKVNTATLFICIGLALAFEQNARTRLVTRVLAVTVLLVATATFIQYVTASELGIDELLLRNPEQGLEPTASPRMGFNTALAFMLTSLGLLTLDVRLRKVWLSQICALFAAALALTVAVGYAYGVSRFETSFVTSHITPMALHTAVLFMLLAAGILLSRPNVGLTGKLSTPGPGGALRRRLLIPAIVLPLALGYLRIVGQNAGLYGTREGVALFSVALVFLLILVIWWTSDELDRTESDRSMVRAHEQAVIDTALDSVISIDGEGRIIDFVGTAEEMFGIREEDAVGHDLSDLIIPERLREAHRQGVRRVLENPEQFQKVRLESTAVSADGREFAVEIVVGRPCQPTTAELVGNVRDISERKLLESQLRQSQKLEAVGQLAGGVAHEFNNLLTVIAGYVELLEERLSEAGQDELAVIKRTTGRAAEIAGELLAFARQQPLDPVPVSIEEVVTAMTPMLERLIGDDVEVVVITSDSHELVLADRNQIEQVVVNLAVNSRDAMPLGGRLMFEIGAVDLDWDAVGLSLDFKPGRFVRMSVTDDGSGIEPDVIDHIFEPFFTTKEVGKGSGLGLSMVYGIVTQSGGEIRVQSRPGFGTTFEIFLPVVAATGSAAESEPVFVTSRARGNETVLLCEGDKAVSELIQRILRDAGYEVIVASRPRDALVNERAKSGDFDILVSDVVMPGMSGPELATRLKTEERRIPALLMSGYTADVVRDRGSLPLGSAFIQKPFDRVKFLGRVRQLLDESLPRCNDESHLDCDPSTHE